MKKYKSLFKESIKITGKELHDWITEYIPDFEDADLYHDTKIYKVSNNTDNRIKKAMKLGYLSIDSDTGHEMFYFDLK